MTEKIVLFDFAGTLVKAEIIDEANEFRSQILQRSLPTRDEHADPEKLYKGNREFAGKLTGITKDMSIVYRENDLDHKQLTGEECQNQIATNLFQIGMYMAAKKHGQAIMPEGLPKELERIRSLGYKLATISGARTDIISGMFQIAKIQIEFDYIFGQPPVLGVSHEENLKLLKEHGTIEFGIGDKLSDLTMAKSIGAKAVFVAWGHATGGEEETADHVVKTAKDLRKVIQ